MRLISSIVIAGLCASPVLRAEDASSAIARGAEVYVQYCALCHGASGHGDGRAAHVQSVRPADLTASTRSDEYKRRIIANGGASMNRSNSMPAWRDVLSDEEMNSLVRYLRSIVSDSRAQSPNSIADQRGAQ